jgi:hypothetical protein
MKIGDPMHKINLLALVFMMGLLGNEKAIAQIPGKGADFSTLASLRWGMTMKDALDSIGAKREIKKTTSTTLSYEDTLLNTKAIITLKFVEKDSDLILDFIDAPFTEPNRELAQLVEKYLSNRYGLKYESKKEKKSKFFITIEMEFKRWRFNNEEVGLVICNRGEEILGINLTYHLSELK